MFSFAIFSCLNYEDAALNDAELNQFNSFNSVNFDLKEFRNIKESIRFYELLFEGVKTGYN